LLIVHAPFLVTKLKVLPRAEVTHSQK